MKYDRNTDLGLTWAGLTEVRHAYDWDPATFIGGVRESDIVGVEAPLWTETIRNITAAQQMAFPPLPPLAATAAELYAELRQRHSFQLTAAQLKVALNSDFSDWSSPLKHGDTVVFIPPVAGG